MTMASRDIANMHLFLEMKKKFPDLPDDTLRNYVFLYSKDQDKCINILQQESEYQFHPSQPFTDIRLSESKTPRKSDFIRTADVPHNATSHSSASYLPDKNVQLPDDSIAVLKLQNPAVSNTENPRSKSYVGVTHHPFISNIKVPLKSVPHSAPVISNDEKPFMNMYQERSSHSTACQSPPSYDRMMFSTTKEHTVQAPTLSNTENLSFSPPRFEAKEPKRHAVELSIIPSFPFQHQQQMNVVNNSFCATATHSSRPGRHTTSLNFQLQPQSSDQSPLEISTVPTNIGDSCNSHDFGSHVQISVGSQGTTFTALRLQRPQPVQNQSKYSAKLSSEPVAHNFSASSQVPDSKLYIFPNKIQLNSDISKNGKFTESVQNNFVPLSYQKFFRDENKNCHIKNPDSQESILQSHQLSPEYVTAVKCHQKSSLKLVQEEVDKSKNIVAQLKAEINRIEQDINERLLNKNSLPYSEELKLLREENRKLRVECNCLLMDVDMSSTTQIPLGMTDEDFYSNIFTGPNRAISSSSKQSVPNLNSAEENKDCADEEDDEKNRWRCKKCTFANYPALKNCEMCELPRNSGLFFDEA